MVYYLGGGTFDVSIIEMGDGVQAVSYTHLYKTKSIQKILCSDKNISREKILKMV